MFLLLCKTGLVIFMSLLAMELVTEAASLHLPPLNLEKGVCGKRIKSVLKLICNGSYANTELANLTEYDSMEEESQNEAMETVMSKCCNHSCTVHHLLLYCSLKRREQVYNMPIDEVKASIPIVNERRLMDDPSPMVLLDLLMGIYDMHTGRFLTDRYPREYHSHHEPQRSRPWSSMVNGEDAVIFSKFKPAKTRASINSEFENETPSDFKEFEEGPDEGIWNTYTKPTIGVNEGIWNTYTKPTIGVDEGTSYPINILIPPSREHTQCRCVEREN